MPPIALTDLPYAGNSCELEGTHYGSVPHRFTNTGSGHLRTLDIHLSDHVITEWLDNEPAGH